ncbi:anhydro-N-acetylmuramic acid kinase [Franzmannia pantelleriensis]|uniref:Anhydro-N-acetylmuramic acid kinase n=1 Tax=Franzmannia pantelleriensis TaxID=48727 RepID=A0A1G9TJT1_9GAMM|nr:anhydro-N-acetylmuramic acid kinase [Halomonas pantelleriensis]SDM47903.1 anhydro-N-acetylmuramic acid kinase [Halomonas pantelleriensis]
MPRFLGLMSGTSLDAIDAALLRIDEAGHLHLEQSLAEPLPPALRERLLTLCQATSVSFAELAYLEDAFCRHQASAATRLLAAAGLTPSDVEAIGSHGQTIEHSPYGHTGGPAYTLQLDNPSLLAELTGCRVVADFRRRDLAAGGQAAPLAPAFHDAVFRHADEWRLVLNLGGFANLTLLPPLGSDAKVIGFDTGPANALLDAWHQRQRGGSFDADGAWAASGRVDPTLLAKLLDDTYFKRPPPKSTGREVFHLEWLDSRLSGSESPADVQATLAELSAVSIARGVELVRTTYATPLPARVIPCGGGAHNADLMARLAAHLPGISVTQADALGWPADWLEAAAFAWLAWRRLAGLPGNLPSVTGAAGPRVLGGIYSA